MLTLLCICMLIVNFIIANHALYLSLGVKGIDLTWYVALIVASIFNNIPWMAFLILTYGS